MISQVGGRGGWGVGGGGGGGGGGGWGGGGGGGGKKGANKWGNASKKEDRKSRHVKKNQSANQPLRGGQKK